MTSAANTPALPSKNITTSTFIYTALGDSISTAKGLSDPSLAYPAVLANMIRASLASTNVIAEDLSIGGMRTSELQAQEIPFIDPKTALVTLMIGHNDIWIYRDQYDLDPAGADVSLASLQQAYIDDIMAIRRAAPNAAIIVANIRNLDRINATPNLDLDYILTRMDAMIANLRSIPGVIILDLQCGFPDQYEVSLFTDWVHMTAQGHAAVAQHFFAAYNGTAPALAPTCSPTVVP